MALPISEEAGPLREWAPETRLLQQIPLKVQKGLFSYDLNLTCIDVVSEYIAVGTDCGLVYWYCRVTGELQRLRFEVSICFDFFFLDRVVIYFFLQEFKRFGLLPESGFDSWLHGGSR